jgi:flavodoxin
MRAIVVYYSESGNTQKVAQAVGAGLGTQDRRVEEVKIQELPTYDLICIGTPVQGGAPAKKVLDFISQMPALNGKKAAAFCTMHMFGDKKTILILRKVLEARGMVFLGGFTALGWSASSPISGRVSLTAADPIKTNWPEPRISAAH